MRYSPTRRRFGNTAAEAKDRPFRAEPVCRALDRLGACYSRDRQSHSVREQRDAVLIERISKMGDPSGRERIVLETIVPPPQSQGI